MRGQLAHLSFDIDAMFQLARTAICLAFFICTASIVAETTKPEAEAFFESKIKPVLEKHCYECHGGGEKIRAELVLTNREDLMKGGESGPAISLDSPADSLLLEAVNYESYEMPPSGKLPKEDIDNIAKWVAMGVPWKGEGFKPKHAEHATMAPAVNDETKSWWSFQKPIRHQPPTNTHHPVTNPIDAFVVSRLESSQLTPNPRADKRTLIRRAYYDLTGLPPSPVDVEAFVEDQSPDAYRDLIDRLLASKHYGEKWGRHWLDIVRYAESNSYERDDTKPFVWRYRDYVIRSFNDDKPYDQFVMEQLAGDELDSTVPDNIIATGYYRLGLWDDEPVDQKQAWFDDMDDVLKTTTDSFLGLTVGCARCHDHKIDPIPQADYYSFLSFFGGVQRYGGRSHDTVIKQSTRLLGSDEEAETSEKSAKDHEAALKKLEKSLRKIEELVKKDFIDVEHEEFKHQMNRIPLVKKRVGKPTNTRP
jgi:mono/diheme cytochrome c family protein